MKLVSSQARSRALLSFLFCTAGTLHFALPRLYMTIMPPYLPWHYSLVLLSGACEICGGIGMIVSRSRIWAGWGLCALLLAVWPANFQMLFNGIAAHATAGALFLLVARLPLQPLLMVWVWRATRTESKPLIARPGKFSRVHQPD